MKPRTDGIRGMAGLTALALLWMTAACGPARGADPRADITAQVAMADGTTLATDVYLPDKGEGPWPVRLIRTPYGRVRYLHEYGRQSEHGYAMVAQDMRGRFDSQGRDLAFIDCGWNEHQDGVDTLKWILQQPWCNGKIGTEGASAMGITQCMLGGASPPGVQAQYILVAAPSLYHHATYIHGALRASLVIGWLTDNGFDADNAWLSVLHPFYDAHWQQLDSIARAERVILPAVHFGGWYDVFCQGTIDGFTSRQHEGGKGARGAQKLIVGPWGHGGPNGKPIGTLTFPDNARKIPHPIGATAWFDHYLKGADNGIEKTPAVQYYTMGAVDEDGAAGNEWKTADDWPVKAVETCYYLHTGGMLSTAKPPADGAGGARSFTFNPLNPVPTRGGCLLVLPAGGFDQRDMEVREDVLVFRSEPLAAPLEVTGRIRAKLTIASDRVDTDFTVKLVDIYPDGRCINIADGLARCRYRKGFDRLVLLTPGEPAEIEVDCWSTSFAFNTGHRIGVHISSSNYPKYDVNPNTGWPAWPMGPVVPARNQVICAGPGSSCLVLPVVEGIEK